MLAIPMVTINAVSVSPVHTGAKAIAAGDYCSMVLKQDGTVWATGRAGPGNFGDGAFVADRLTFVKVMSSGQCDTMVGKTDMHIPTPLCPPHTHTTPRARPLARQPRSNHWHI